MESVVASPPLCATRRSAGTTERGGIGDVMPAPPLPGSVPGFHGRRPECGNLSCAFGAGRHNLPDASPGPSRYHGRHLKRVRPTNRRRACAARERHPRHPAPSLLEDPHEPLRPLLARRRCVAVESRCHAGGHRLVLSAIGNDLARAETVNVAGFGTFSTTTRAARRGQSPATGESIDIGASTALKFKAGQDPARCRHPVSRVRMSPLPAQPDPVRAPLQ